MSISRRLALLGAFAAASSPLPAFAACGGPTTRILPVGTEGGLKIGLRTYPRTLALSASEVVLTFDDGPSPDTTPRVLDALSCAGVRATFFLIGAHAAEHPSLVRRIRAEGHTLACHSRTHPWTMRDIGEAAAIAQAEQGFADIARAAGQDAGAPWSGAVAPFFRYPGFADTAAVNGWLAQRGIGVFGCDLWASDWVLATPEHQLTLTLSRLRAARGGIVLFHDTRHQTARMIGPFLAALKTEGFRVVHIVAGPGTAATAAARPGWTSETERIIAATRPKRGA